MSPRPPDIDAAPSTSPKRWPWGMVLGLCLVGLGLSIMLERIHFKIHTQPDFQSFCAISRKVNCDVVARSKYALWLGTPVAAWGILAYLLAALVATWGMLRRRSLLAAGCGLYIGLAFTLASAALGLISALIITAVCLLCLATYGVNLLILLGTLLAARRPGIRAALVEPWRALRARPGRGAMALIALAAVAAGLPLLYPAHGKESAELPVRPTTPTLPHGIEPGGGHYIGAIHPALTITEFSDYECPFCRQAHTKLRALLEQYPTLLRVVHRHYPLDQSCNPSLKLPVHQSACFAADVAECAGLQNRFWEANDYLFSQARELHARTSDEIAHDLGLDPRAFAACLDDQGPRSVALDIDAGNRLDIQGTPTFLIAGKATMGSLPEWVPKRLAELASGSAPARP
ncbi:MAG: vitamin K epoxide reductase family protein [Polyangia bacterium]